MKAINTITNIILGILFLFLFLIDFKLLEDQEYDIIGRIVLSILSVGCWFSLLAGIYELFICSIIGYIHTKYFLTKTIRGKYSIYQKVLEEYTLCQKLKKAEYWLQMDGYEFEKATALVFQKLGYSVKLTKIGADGGIDIIVNYKNGVNIPVQCKAHNKPIGVPFLREFYGVMIHNDYTQGIFVSRSGYTSYVQDFIKDKQITLLDLSHLIQYTD